ncbi:MAG: iron-dependent peroxidase [Marmoricola sp.]|nr:iron-dependent peroxidase [Marmoricola sp.]
MTIDRRSVLRGTAAAVGGAALVGATSAGSRPSSTTQETSSTQDIPFHGEHQSGILNARQAAAAFVAFDLTTTGKQDVIDLMRSLTDRARILTTGGRPPDLGISAPPSDSGVLGPVVPGDGLSITLGMGASAFEGHGITKARPTRLRTMETFPDDNLDRSRCDGDLVLQLCADNRDTVIHALRDLARHTRGGMQVRWRVDGFAGPPRPSGAPRNLMGFKDGTANPKPSEADKLIWSGADEPAWAAGGSYQVVRVIRMLVEFWDRVTIAEQERMIGRRRDTGAPLSGNRETDTPAYGNDPLGSTTPLDAHIRMANPRTPQTDESRLLRRGYNYDAGVDSNGNLDMGLVFACYQQDLDRQFVAVQHRLAGEPLTDYISPVGGGFFYALPGVTDNSDWFGRSLLS